jgi:hypothetical protein
MVRPSRGAGIALKSVLVLIWVLAAICLLCWHELLCEHLVDAEPCACTRALLSVYILVACRVLGGQHRSQLGPVAFDVHHVRMMRTWSPSRAQAGIQHNLRVDLR